MNSASAAYPIGTPGTPWGDVLVEGAAVAPTVIGSVKGQPERLEVSRDGIAGDIIELPV